MVPDHHPGAAESAQRTQLRTLLKQVDAEGIEGLLEGAPEKGGPGFAVFQNTDGAAYLLASGVPSKVQWATHPYVMPLLEQALVPRHFFVLELSSTHVRLLEYLAGVCTPRTLPTGVPRDVSDAGHYHHGGPGMDEAVHDRVAHFFALVDHGLRPHLQELPLLLMGVREDIAAYRRGAHYPEMFEAEVDGNVEGHTAAQVAALAHRAAVAEYKRAGERVLAEFREMRDQARAERDPHAVLRAAAAGRVHQLCVRGGTELLGPLESGHVEDIVNAAVVETLRHSGKVYLLPSESMPITECLCAVLRF
jgi:hypothetical protein